jgi:predicted PurR-regulated permease PerM
MTGERVRKSVFLVLFLCLFVLVARLFYPFLSIILWSGLIYVLLYKIYDRAALRRDGKERREPARTLIAGGFALGSIIVIVVPAVLLGRAVLKELGDLAGEIARTFEKNPQILDLSPDGAIGGFLFRLSGGQIDLSSINLVQEIKRFAAGKSGAIIGLSGTLLKDAAGLILNLAFMVFTLYFFFVDGEHLAKTFISAIPLEREYTKLFLRKLRDSGKQLLVGYFLVALFQATMMFLICLVMGVKGGLVLGALTAVGSFIPMIGTAIVWLPTAIGIALGGDITKAVIFLVASAVLVATLDNFIRPILLHERLKIHPLLIFFSILGGLKIFGFNGLVLGPLILMLFFSAAELYNQAYASKAASAAATATEELKEEGKTERED